jgi:hypothetical protein
MTRRESNCDDSPAGKTQASRREEAATVRHREAPFSLGMDSRLKESRSTGITWHKNAEAQRLARYKDANAGQETFVKGFVTKVLREMAA